MSAGRLTLVLEVAFVLLAFGWRSWQQRRLTGSTGFVATRETGVVAKVAGALFVVGLVALLLGAVMGIDQEWHAADVLGVVAMAGGLTTTLAAQQAMGASWRIGVDPGEVTELVTHGLFRRVRNPIFSAMLLFAAGVVLTVPNWVTGLGLVAAAVGITLQVITIEEPHLLEVHGEQYEKYRSSTGRFVPRMISQ